MSDTLQKLLKRIQDGAGELGEAVLGNRIERTLDQGIRDAGLALHQARADAASAKAQRIAKDVALKACKARISSGEQQIRALLDQRRAKQVRQLAAEVVSREVEQLALAHEARELAGQEAEFLQIILQLEHKLRRMNHQLGTLRATTGIQRAQAAVARLQPGPDTHPESAQASAQRLRERSGEVTVAVKKTVSAKHKPTKASETDSAVDRVIERLSGSAATRAKKAATRKVQ